MAKDRISSFKKGKPARRDAYREEERMTQDRRDAYREEERKTQDHRESEPLPAGRKFSVVRDGKIIKTGTTE